MLSDDGSVAHPAAEQDKPVENPSQPFPTNHGPATQG
jgi:hypothetical protein